VCISDQTVGEVIRMGVAMGEGPRKAWGRSPDSLVLRVLQEAELQSLTQSTLEDISTSGQGKTSCSSSSSSNTIYGQHRSLQTSATGSQSEHPHH